MLTEGGLQGAQRDPSLAGQALGVSSGSEQAWRTYSTRSSKATDADPGHRGAPSGSGVKVSSRWSESRSCVILHRTCTIRPRRSTKSSEWLRCTVPEVVMMGH
ncbi:hypothetical protein [Nesterenkonia pannonica]|uniref:hypothetical protein n=1 Tax=Nesterenkonia pannonica TaxID=1548602 RepID=UPI0021643D41|nr:hypothetical protein [Nesterenkonia pannonica]